LSNAKSNANATDKGNYKIILRTKIVPFKTISYSNVTWFMSCLDGYANEIRIGKRVQNLED